MTPSYPGLVARADSGVGTVVDIFPSSGLITGRLTLRLFLNATFTVSNLNLPYAFTCRDLRPSRALFEQ